MSQWILTELPASDIQLGLVVFDPELSRQVAIKERNVGPRININIRLLLLSRFNVAKP